MPLSNPTLAFGLNAVSDRSSACPFIDMMKQARPWYASDTSTVSGATTDATGYAIGATVITLASAGTGTLAANSVIAFGEDSTTYLVTSGDADVSNGGTITIEALIGGGGLVKAIPAAATAITMQAFAAYSYEALVARGYVDADGWPNAVPPGMSNVGTIFAHTADSYLAGDWVLTYDGGGTLTLSGDRTITTSTAGRIEFTRAGSGSLSLTITAFSDPPIKNIRMFRAEFEPLLAMGAIFNPDWLDVVQDARSLRFMDWQRTNGSTQVEWANRPKITLPTYNSGVPVEIMVALANQTGTDPWFTMPHLATDEYIEEFATYVRDNLNPELVAHVEYSNELWNFIFDQTDWCAAQASAVWGQTGGSSWLNWAAKKATECAVIWKAVFGAEASSRLKCIVGSQTAVTARTTVLLDPTIWEAEEPLEYVDPTTVFDAIAVTTYFGGAITGDQTRAEALLAYRASHTENETYAWLAANMLDPEYGDSVPVVIGWIEAQRAIADANGLELLLYEGGQHMDQNLWFSGSTTQQRADLQAIMAGFVRSSYIVTLYEAMWDGIESLIDGPFMQFVEVSAPATSGSWGMLSGLSDITPRATAMLARNAEQNSWFGDGGGARYVAKTIKAGAAGQDITIGARGGVVAGTSGHELVNVPGAAADYTMSRDPETGFYTISRDGFELVLGGVDGVRYAD